MLAMARSYAHKGLTGMARKDSDVYEIINVECLINHPSLGRCFIGSHVCGIGAFYVHFPVDATRTANDEEINRYTRGRFGCTYAPSFKVEREEFATKEQLETMPVKDWNEFR